MTIIQDIKPRGNDSAYVAAPFDVAKTELEQAGYQVISLEQNAGLRMQEGKDANVSRSGNWTKEGVLYIPNKGVFLTKKSPIMANAKEATSCHRSGKEFYLTDAQVEEALADSVPLSVKSVPTNRFGDCDITNYAFGKYAKHYGEFLREAGIKEMPVWLANVTDKAFARQMWLCRLVDDSRSVLYGSGNLDGSDRVRGVRGKQTGEASSQKTPEVFSYTPKHLRVLSKVLHAQGITGKLEKSILEGVKQ